MAESTGYGPSSRWNRLYFNGDADKYDDEVEGIYETDDENEFHSDEDYVPQGSAARNEVETGQNNVTERPQRTRKLPNHLEEYVMNDRVYCVQFCYRSTEIVVPNTYKQAVESPEAESWKRAMDDEIDSLKENNTYSLVKLPYGKTCVGGRWVYAIKTGLNGEDVFKARYVAKGFTQKYGVDYSETFAPTARFTTLRVFMQLAVQLDLIVHQMDVKTAYLHAEIDHELYMEQPKGYEESILDVEGKVVCRLNRSLYGLKQSGRNWNQMLHNFFIKYKFTQSKADVCVYIQKFESGVIIVLIWVDDMIIGASNVKLMNKIKGLLKQTFRMKDMGPISWFVGIKFTQEDGYITMSQSEYLNNKIKEFGMEDAKPRGTPCEVSGYKYATIEESEEVKYREMVGSIIYAMTCTRPDLSWIVSRLSQNLNSPTPTDTVMLKHVFRYLIGTLNHKLTFTKSEGGLKLFGFSDADWGNSEDRKSVSGYYFALNKNGPAISWKSKRQSTVALSSCESEYIALTVAAQETLYLSQLLNGFIKLELCTTVISSSGVQLNADNQGAIRLSRNPVHHNRSKHFDIKYHFIRDLILKKKIDTVYVPSAENIADIMTKPVTKPKLRLFHEKFFGCVR